MTLTTAVWICFGLALVINLPGFRRFVYFLNVGYALSILAMALATGLLFYSKFTIGSFVHIAGLGLWGLRLGVFVVRRELSPSFKKERAAINQQYGNIRFPMRVLIWITVSFLYVLMFLPALLHLLNAPFTSTPVTTLIELAGLLIAAGGLLLETLSDRQKSAFKALNPRTFCSSGLYQFVRCPNYLGEILFWVGSWVMAIPFYTNAWHWVASLFATVCIVLIMMGSTKRLEAKQGRRYGSLPEYQQFIQTVPILFPFVPVYTLQSVRVIIE